MILALAVAFAGEGALVVMPTSGGPDSAAVERALERAGLEEEASIEAASFAAGVRLVRPPTTWGDDCLETTHLPAWRARLDAARRRYDLLDSEGSLADLVLLDLELECLADPVSASTLVSLDVARAEAHLLLEAASAHDLAQAAFHHTEAARALDRVMATGPELVPAEASPELAEGLAAARRRRREAPVAAATPLGSGESLRINGRLLPPEGVGAAEGDNVIQRIDSTGAVVGASRLSLRSGEVAIFSGPVGSASMADLVESLARGAPTRDEESALASLAESRGEGRVVVYAGWSGGPALWRVMRGRLVRLEVPRGTVAREAEEAPVVPPRAGRAPRVVVEPEERDVMPTVGAWRATAGLRLGGGWREEGGAGALSAGLAGRVALGGDWAAAWGVLPEADAESLDPGGEGVSARVPLRVGARWGPHRAGWAAEVGPDVGLLVLPDDDPRPLLGVCGGGAVATGPTVAVRLEACVDSDFVGASVGAALSVESRI